MKKNTIDVSIILVNYFTSDYLKNAVKSIKEMVADINYEIIVVDNSVNGKEYKKVKAIKGIDKVIKNSSNSGFGSGNNLGVKKSVGKYLLFLNCDTILLNNAVLELHNSLNSISNASIVGANIYSEDLKPGLSYSYREKKTSTAFGLFIKKAFDKLFNKNKTFNYKNKPMRLKGYVSGACLMINREDFERLGGFDERIFMYSEEALLCYLVRHELKKDIYNIPTAKIVHLESKSFEGISNKKAERFVDGNYQYYQILFGNQKAKRCINARKNLSRLEMLFIKKNNPAYLGRKTYYLAFKNKLNDINTKEAVKAHNVPKRYSFFDLLICYMQHLILLMFCGLLSMGIYIPTSRITSYSYETSGTIESLRLAVHPNTAETMAKMLSTEYFYKDYVDALNENGVLKANGEPFASKDFRNAIVNVNYTIGQDVPIVFNFHLRLTNKQDAENAIPIITNYICDKFNELFLNYVMHVTDINTNALTITQNNKRTALYLAFIPLAIFILFPILFDAFNKNFICFYGHKGKMMTMRRFKKYLTKNGLSLNQIENYKYIEDKKTLVVHSCATHYDMVEQYLKLDDVSIILIIEFVSFIRPIFFRKRDKKS